GRRRAEGRQGRRQQGRGREDQEADRGSRRNRRAQVRFRASAITQGGTATGRPFRCSVALSKKAARNRWGPEPLDSQLGNALSDNSLGDLHQSGLATPAAY